MFKTTSSPVVLEIGMFRSVCRNLYVECVDSVSSCSNTVGAFRGASSGLLCIFDFSPWLWLNILVTRTLCLVSLLWGKWVWLSSQALLIFFKSLWRCLLSLRNSLNKTYYCIHRLVCLLFGLYRAEDHSVLIFPQSVQSSLMSVQSGIN